MEDTLSSRSIDTDNNIEGPSSTRRTLIFYCEKDDEEHAPTMITEEEMGSTPLSQDKEPYVGLVFESEDIAYEFYNAYGRNVGFSVRKGKVFRSRKGFILGRVYLCAKESRRRIDKRRENVVKERRETRSNCMARMLIKSGHNSSWVVKEFIEQHNHECVTPTKAHMLRSQRKIQLAQVAQILTTREVGIGNKESYDLMSKEAGGRENLGYERVDHKKNLSTKRMMDLANGDASALLDYFQMMQLDNPSFFYAIQVDKDSQLTNFFWADARVVIDYGHFGDVVCFDATYKTNSYGRPFTPFVGINHHKQTVLFGAALLFDETINSFVWLFETWIKAMLGRHPKTILTDQSAAISRAISLVFPETHHCLCIWHILQNAAKHLSHVYSSSNDFSKDFSNCIYGHYLEEDFIYAWDEMLTKHNLVENDWLKDLFKERKKWALVYGRHSFCADMTTTQRSESINSFFKRYLHSRCNITEFLNGYERALDDRRYEELVADFKDIQSTPKLWADVPMLKHARKEYTSVIFEMFQEEYKKFLSYNVEVSSEDGSVSTYKVSSVEKKLGKKSKQHIVTFDSLNDVVVCTCKKFEFVGIQCRHVLKVFNHRNVNDLPAHYILKRWKKYAKLGVIKDDGGRIIESETKVTMGSRYSSLCRKFVNIATKAATSEETYAIVQSNLKQMLKDIEDIMKGQVVEKSSNVSTHQVNVNEGELVRKIRKVDGPRGNRRILGALERGKGKSRKSQINTNKPKSKKGKKGIVEQVDLGMDEPPFDQYFRARFVASQPNPVHYVPSQSNEGYYTSLLGISSGSQMGSIHAPMTSHTSNNSIPNPLSYPQPYSSDECSNLLNYGEKSHRL